MSRMLCRFLFCDGILLFRVTFLSVLEYVRVRFANDYINCEILYSPYISRPLIFRVFRVFEKFANIKGPRILKGREYFIPIQHAIHKYNPDHSYA